MIIKYIRENKAINNYIMNKYIMNKYTKINCSAPVNI